MIAGRYSLDREIGRGGTGPVWAGRDDLLGRRVALKQIGRTPGTDSTDLARAEREARLGAKLNHAHVVAIFDVVTDPDTETRWLVMEHVDGVNLAELVRDRGPLTAEDAAPLLWQVADALVAAHAAGIAHRDVKPSNILVDREGRAKLTDFGIARVAADPALTQTGLVTGSPAYLAPEVATGARGDAPADVWSFGATAFHALAGRPPYEIGDNVLGALYRIAHEEPPRLAEAGRLAPLLEGTMVRDPAGRWSMGQARDFLARSDGRLDPGPRLRATARSEPAETSTRVVPTVAPPPGAAAERGRSGAASRLSSRSVAAALAVLLVLVGAGVLVVALRGNDSPSESTGSRSHPSTSPTAAKPTAAKPTAAGMEAFIRGYVAAVADDPARAWTMLTPKFQRESGGFAQYRSFWDGATNGRVLSITADPTDLTVSYQVRFDHFHNGPGPTILDLEFDHGRYRIDGEHTKGFVPDDD